MKPLISVIICTFNRCSDLLIALETLLNQTLDISDFEIVVVDNNSTDETAISVTKLCNKHQHIRYIFEPEQGLSHARNRGWREAYGDYIAYTDDDCKLPQEWLSTAKNIIDEISPPSFGGPFYPFYNSPKPKWFKDEYGSYTEGNQAHFLEAGHLSGGNLFISRAVLEELNGFNTQLGMTGRKIGLGEETDLIKRIRQELGLSSIYYAPNLYVYHLVNPIKYKLTYHLNRCFITGRNVYTIFGSESTKFFWIKESVKVATSLVSKLSIGFLLRNKDQYPHIGSYIYEVIGRTTIGLGRVYEHYYLKFHPDVEVYPKQARLDKT